VVCCAHIATEGQGFQHEENEPDQNRRVNGQDHKAQTGKHAYGGRNPDTGRRGEAAHAGTVSENRSRSQEPYPRYNISRHSCQVGLPWQGIEPVDGSDTKAGGARRHEHMCA
jgi:hypothetical protein